MPLDLQPSAEDIAMEKAMRSDAPYEPAKVEVKSEPVVETKTEPVKEETPVKAEVETQAITEKAKPEPVSEQAKKPSYADTIRDLRAERRQLREELKQTKSQQQEMERRIQERLDRLQNPPQAKPDPSIDPDGAMRAELAELREEIKPIKEMTAEQKRADEFRKQTQTRIDSAREYEVENLEDGFLDEHPDYKDVTAFAYQQRLEDAMIIADNEQQARAMVLNDMLQIAERAKATGKNYAEMLYKYGMKRGYQAKPAAKDQAKETTAQATTDALKALDGGNRAARTVAKGSGAGNQKGLTVQELLAMSDSDFDKYSSDRATVKRLFGG